MWRWVLSLVSLLLWPAMTLAVERFPAPDFRGGHKMPATEVSPVPSLIRGYIDVAVLTGALALAAWLVYKKRSRRGVFWLTIFSLIYFGFYRKGCICPVGSIGNVAFSAGGNGYVLPWIVAAFFALPLLFTLFHGRVFCSSVCPLGAIQDLALWRPVRVPAWLEQGLGLFAYVYLGLAVMFAAVGSELIICRYDPFVGFFRLSGPAHMLFLGAVFLITSMFVGRVYCRFVCPYGVLLRLLSPFSRKQVSITPKDCVDCRLCEQACPFGAIRYPTPKDKTKRTRGRRQLLAMLILLPMLMGLFAGFGYLGRSAFARMDVTVQLAERLWQEEHHLVEGATDPSKAFRATGEPIERAYQRANIVRRRFAIASPLFGAWIGLAIGGKLIALVLRRQRTGYTADPAGCVACGRCYESCPVEHEHRQMKADLVAV
jgi:NAD-dependent dihydropyrimidine dehydrogenase PreA subunit